MEPTLTALVLPISLSIGLPIIAWVDYRVVRAVWRNVTGYNPPQTPIFASFAATEGGTKLLLDETDRSARRFQHFCVIAGFSWIVLGLVFVAIVPRLLPIPIALWIGGIGMLVMASRVRQHWEIDYLGHSVRFENSVYTSGRLMIDGKTMASGGIGFGTELGARIPSGPGAGDRIVVKTRAGFLSFRCQIYVDANVPTPAVGINPSAENGLA